MFKRNINAGLMGGILALGLTLSGQVLAKFTAEDAAELNAEAKATLEKFMADTERSKAVIADATSEGSRFKKLDVEE